MQETRLAPPSLDTAGSLLSDLWRFAGMRRLLPVAGLIMLGGLAEGVGLAMIVPLVALIAAPGHGPSWFHAPDLVLGGFVLAIALRALVLAARDGRMAGLEAHYVEARRIGIVRALAASRWEDLAALRHARITFTLAGEVQRLASAVRQMATLGMSMVMLAIQFVLLSVLSWRLALLFCLAALVTGALAVPGWRRAERKALGDRKGNLAILDLATQLLGGLKLALAQNLQDAFVAEMEAASQTMTRRHHAHERDMGRARVIGATMAAGALAAMVWTGLHSGMAAAALVGSLAISVRMLGPGMAILRSYQLLAGALPSHAMIAELVGSLGAPDPEPASSHRDWTGAIRLSGLSYRNGQGTVDFTDIDLTIPPGARIGLSGPSGAGKTSFADLLCGLLAPQSGRIEVDGHAMKGAALRDWRGRIGYVAQDCYLFHDTLRRNLTWGIAADEADILHALEIAEARDILQRLPDGLDTMAGERGIRLSGGERQRLALARALIRRPRLLILDEATNALDLACEARIMGRLTSLPDAPTLVVIAHRPQVLAMCDSVLNFDQGRLISVTRNR